MKPFSLKLLLVLLASLTVHAAEPSHDRFSAVTQVMERFVSENVIAGGVTMIATSDKILHTSVTGYADLKTRQKMEKDSLMWIASMTKPIVAVAVLMLQDEGKLSVEDPVEKHLPEFKEMRLLADASNERQVTVPAPRKITIRDLLTHTSAVNELKAGPGRHNATLAELVMGYSQRPLRYPPGEKWEYNNPGINILGRIVEVVSGQKFEDFMDQRIFKPLGMKDTTFWPGKQQVKRVAKSYKVAQEGKGLEETPVFLVSGDLSDRTRTPFPAGGLYSTAGDIVKFYQMMLNRGEFKGKQLLSQKAVEEMTRTQTGDLKTGFTNGMSWGFGFQVVKNPIGVTEMLSPGTFGHGGAYATQSWADPKKGIIYVMMIQRAGFPNGDDSIVRKEFQKAAAAALSK
ncbi:MAG: serine hydrolase domain-containing protein [Verrucomicrobiota bacterium]|nr:serine hydrolase domain-containing protein [Verrucomicrobiota bacterium]